MSGRRKGRKGRRGYPRFVDHSINTSNHDAAFNLNITVINSRRLSWQHATMGAFSAEKLAGIIENYQNKHVTWYCDTNCFIGETDRLIWDALLAKQGRMVLTSPVYKELTQWLADPKYNPEIAAQIIHAVEKPEDSRITLRGYEGIDEITQILYEYYVRLLGIRKYAYSFLASELTAANGRTPTNQELSNYCKDQLGPRAQLLAISGATAKVSSHKLNDEQLVIMAVVSAICSAQETAILTKDEDVYEQFCKAIWLIDTHYRSMLLAEQQAANPNAFPVVNRFVDVDRKAFDGEVILLRKPSNNLIEILPSQYTPVAIHCFLVRDSIFHTKFTAEQEMGRVLKMKGTTGGLSTDRLAGRNCHIFIGGLGHQWGNHAAIGQDAAIAVSSGSCKLSPIDVNITITDGERGTPFNDFPLLLIPSRREVWPGPGTK